MDEKELQQKIAEYYTKLSPKAQASFSSMQWMERLKEISKKYTLSSEQMQTIGTETTLVLLGINSIEQYAENLANEIELPEDSMTKMLTEIGDTVLRDVQSDIDTAYKNNLQSLEAEEKEAEVSSDPKFASLPAELQSAIAQSDYQKKLYEIATSYKLQVENMGKLEDLTVRFITGAMSPSQYENSLALELDLEAGKARELATQVNSSILQNIRDTMKAMDTRKAEAMESQKNTVDSDSAPLPPYALPKVEPVKATTPKATEVPVRIDVDNISMPKPAETVVVSESHAQIYRDAGIEILDDTAEPSTPARVNAGKKVEAVDTMKLIDSFHEELKNITQAKAQATEEAIIPAPQKSGLEIAKEKLEGFTATPTTVSDHSLSKSTDPYHEAIE
jgi:hypothetical protein